MPGNSAFQRLLADDSERNLQLQLPSTSGFFFGESNGTEKQEDTETFLEALAWLATPDEEAWRSIIYQASW